MSNLLPHRNAQTASKSNIAYKALHNHHAPTHERFIFMAQAGNGVFGGLFPFFFPFSPPCAAVITINPWVPATTIPAPPPGLLTFVNNVAVFSDVSLCPGGKLNFQWTVCCTKLFPSSIYMASSLILTSGLTSMQGDVEKRHLEQSTL